MRPPPVEASVVAAPAAGPAAAAATLPAADADAADPRAPGIRGVIEQGAEKLKERVHGLGPGPRQRRPVPGRPAAEGWFPTGLGVLLQKALWAAAEAATAEAAAAGSDTRMQRRVVKA